MKKITVKVNGQDTEIELPDGYLSAEEIEGKYVPKDRVDGLIEDRLARQKRSLRKSLLEDEDFRTEAATSWGLVEKGKAAKPDEDTFKQWSKEHVEPLKSRLTEQEKRAQTLLQRTLEKELVAAAMATGVRKELLAKLPNGKVPFVVMHEDVFGVDEQSGQFYVKRGDSFAPSSKPEGDRLYKDVSEYIGDLAKNADYKGLFEAADNSMRGPNFKGPSNGSGRPGTITNGDLQAFGSNLEAIAKGTVVVTEG